MTLAAFASRHVDVTHGICLRENPRALTHDDNNTLPSWRVINGYGWNLDDGRSHHGGLYHLVDGEVINGGWCRLGWASSIGAEGNFTAQQPESQAFS